MARLRACLSLRILSFVDPNLKFLAMPSRWRRSFSSDLRQTTALHHTARRKRTHHLPRHGHCPLSGQLSITALVKKQNAFGDGKMLRQVLNSPLVRKGSASLLPSRRMLTAATSRQKRALNKQQLGGEKSGPAAGASAPAATEPPSGASTTIKATEGGGSSGGGGSAIPIALALAAVGGGVAYYMDLVPEMDSLTGGTKTDTKPEKEAESESTTDKAAVSEEEAASKTASEATTTVAATQDEDASPPGTESSGNRVVKINVPAAGSRSEPPIVVIDHPAGGNRVLMEPSKGHEATVDTALQELEKELAAQSSRSLSEAHEELAKLYSLDMSDIDTLTETQLKVRLVQMAKDLEERTKWEAVRLKEFLAMKEKETADE